MKPMRAIVFLVLLVDIAEYKVRKFFHDRRKRKVSFVLPHPIRWDEIRAQIRS